MCDECYASSRVLDTTREATFIARIRECHGGRHIFRTAERPSGKVTDPNWAVNSTVLVSRNQLFRIVRDRQCANGTAMRTIERLIRSHD